MKRTTIIQLVSKLVVAYLIKNSVWLLATAPTAWGIVPQYTISDGSVTLTGVDGTNAIIYDNDWWFDVFDNNYLWAQASLGQAKLVGNVVTRDMWDWEKGYLYPMQRCVDDAHKAIARARQSGLRGIPDATLGSDCILKAPASGRIEDTQIHPSNGSRLIVREARKASPNKPLLVIAGGPLTTVANALLMDPEIAPNMVVFGLTVSYYGYNGKDGWSAYVVANRTHLVEWATKMFWERGSVFGPHHFANLPDNPFCNEMKAFIKTNLGMANQLGDGAPLVWLYAPACWTGAQTRRAVWKGKAVEFITDTPGDVLDIPRANTDLKRCREEFFRVLGNPAVYESSLSSDQ